MVSLMNVFVHFAMMQHPPMEDVVEKIVTENEKGHGISKCEGRWQNVECGDRAETADEETKQQKRHKDKRLVEQRHFPNL